MFDDALRSRSRSRCRCISWPKMGQAIKRQVQGDRRFRRRPTAAQQESDSSSSSSSNAKWNFDDSRNRTKVTREQKERETDWDRDSDIYCSATGELCFGQSRVPSQFLCKWTNHDIQRDFSVRKTRIKFSFGKRNLQGAELIYRGKFQVGD